MTLRSNIADAARRAFVGISRATLVKADDSKKWQELTLRGEVKRKFTNVEVAHPYGFSAVGKPPVDDQTHEAAEIVLLFPDGDMSHPIAIQVGDRRFRVKGQQDGEVMLHDDLGHQVHLTRSGIVLSAPNSKKIVAQIMGDDASNQSPQASRTPLASYTLTKDSFSYSHPIKIELMVGATFLRLEAGKLSFGSDTIQASPGTVFNLEDAAADGVEGGNKLSTKVKVKGVTAAPPD